MNSNSKPTSREQSVTTNSLKNSYISPPWKDKKQRSNKKHENLRASHQEAVSLNNQECAH